MRMFRSFILALTATAVLGATPPASGQAVAPEKRLRENTDWWPRYLDLAPLRRNAIADSPYGADFDYAQEFAKLDLEAVKRDLRTLMTTSQPWWPADYGHYGPLFIRLAWHASGTYRFLDGRSGADGGQIRFDPLRSWPDNASLDKAVRLLWPIKQKYGRRLSWADLIVLSGTVALESMGFKTIGFAGGRSDDWMAEVVDWGPEQAFLAAQRHDKSGKLKGPLAADHMGLIYVNPEGPFGNPDPLEAAKFIRQSFARMSMNDEETVALIAGGHTFGKAHGAHDPKTCLGPEPAAAPVEQQGFGWANRCGKGHSEDTITSGLEGAWSANPIAWTTQFLDNLFTFEWVQTRSPGGAIQWVPKDEAAQQLVPDAHRPDLRHAPIMLTTDLALKVDPAYRKIALRFRDDPQAFADAFARAWFKLTHRDLGPRSRYLGPDVPEDVFIWQDPVPPIDHKLVDDKAVDELKAMIRQSGLGIAERVRTAWAAAASYRQSDMRGGTNGGRLRLAPQIDWAVNNPAELKSVLRTLARIQRTFNDRHTDGMRISMADLIVLAGATAIEDAARAAGHEIAVPFRPGRTDATQEMTDVASFAVLEPKADGFRNYYGPENRLSPAEALVDRADQLGLTVPEMVVLVGGMRALGATFDGSRLGVLTDRPGMLTTDYFVNLLDMGTTWRKADQAGVYLGVDRASGAQRWTASEVDLVIGAHPELRAVAEVYAARDGQPAFLSDFVAAWTKVMNNGRF